MPLTPEQVQIVRSTAPILQAHGNDITTLFYQTLLSEIPELHNVFNTANQANGLQPKALANSLYAYAAHIDDLGALSPALEKICQKHASLYVRPEHYKIVGDYLLRAMGDVLGAALTKEILEAWEVAYQQLASIMIAKEGQIMEDAGGWTDWREFRIAKKVKESEEITSFYLKPVDGKTLPAYKPGQYISVMTAVPKLNYLQPRQYSLSGKYTPDHYRISVKKEVGVPADKPEAVVHPGYISNVLHNERNEGDVLSVSHPAGDFYLDLDADKDAPVVLLSAGVGLTPMVCILDTLVDAGSNRRISFVHAARNTSVQAFGDYVRYIEKQHDNVSASFFIGAPDAQKDVEGVHYQHIGRMRLVSLNGDKDLCLSDKTTQYFVCGPEGFMAAIEKQLIELEVEPHRIKMEVFGTGEVMRN